MSCTAAGQTIYVDAGASAGGNGQTWGTAYNYLQDALAVADPCDEIWVAEGTYKPDANSADPNGSGDRTATFQLINGVTIRGGYAGVGAAEPNERDVEAYDTILGGDLNEDDVGFTNNGDNSYHVVTSRRTDATAVLDGFMITGGNAGGSSYTDPNSKGGGMYNEEGSVTLNNCTFFSNSAQGRGGGMYNYSSSPNVTNCTFAANSATWGGGMANDRYSSPSVNNCTFSENSGGSWGGGMYNDESSPTVNNCTFRANSAGQGGGMHNFRRSSPTVNNCTFRANSAGRGGGMTNYFSSPNANNCTFTENLADNGGGMYNHVWSTSPNVNNCTFTANSALGGGGMANYYSTSPNVTNCTFTANLAWAGGGMHNYDGSNPNVNNCTFTANLAWYGGGMANARSTILTVSNCTMAVNSATNGPAMICDSYEQPSTIAMVNCILWNGDNEIWNEDGSTITIGYSALQGSQTGIYDPCEGVVWGPGNINADPCFVNAGYWDPNGTPTDANDDFWVDGNYHLLPGSPCIDAGDNTAVPPGVTTDLDGHSRFIDDCYTNDTGNGTPPIVDMGAYEFLRSDINSNGPVDFADFSMFGIHWLETDCGECGGADLTCDGQVGWADLREFATNWLAGL